MPSRDIATLGLNVDARQVKEGDKALDSFERTGRRAEQTTDRLTRTQERLARAMKGVVAVLAVREVADLAAKLYEAAAAADRLNLAYKFSFGASAAKELQFVRKLAYDLGLEFQSTATAYGKLSAAARGTALAGEGAKEIFIAVSKASAVMGLSADQTAGALTALEQMISKGTVSSEELKGQLGERLPGAFQIAARAMGKTTQELQKMLEQGEVLAEDFLPKFAKQLEKEIGGAAEQAADRLDAATNRMGDAFKRLMTAAAESGVSDFLKRLAQGAANDMNAISEAMERAKAGGAGTVMQWNAGAGMAIGRTLGLQSLSDDFKTLDGQMRSALATVEKLEAKPKLSLWERSELATARQRIDSITAYRQAREGAANDANAQDARLLAMGKAAQEQQEAAKRSAVDLTETRRKLYGVDKDYLPTLQKLQAQREANAISESEYITLVTALAEKNYTAKKKQKTAGDDLAKQHERAIEHAAEYAAKINQETLELGMNADAQYLYGAAVEANKVKGASEADGIMKAAHAYVAKRRVLKELAEAEEAYAAMRRNRDADVEKVQEKVRALARELELYGMTESQVYAVTVAEKERQIASATWSDEKLEALNAELEALRELQKLSTRKERLDANKEEARKAREEWEKNAERINETLTDALMRGFESGKGFAKNLRDTVVNMFKTMILRPIISAVMQPIGQGIAQGMAGSVGSSIGTSIGGSVLGQMGMSAMGVGSSVAGFSSGFGAASGLAGTGDAAMLAYAQSIGNVSAGATAGASAGSTFAAAAPYLAAAAIAYAIYKKLDTSGTPHAGGASRADQFGVSAIDARSLGTMTVQGSDAMQKTTDAIATGIATVLNSTAAAFGRGGSFAASTAFADDSSKDGAWGALRIDRNGQKLLDWEDTRASRWAPREFANGEDGFKQYTAALASSVRTALDEIGLPAWAQTILDGLGEAPTIEQLGQTIDLINAAHTALANLGGAMATFRNLSDGMVSALVSASGGVGNLVGLLNGFYEGYYTEQEKVDNITRQVTDALDDFNLQMPTTRAAFRALVEQQMQLGESGADAVVALLGVANAFGVIADYNERLAQAQGTATPGTPATSTGPTPEVLRQKRDLEIEIMRLEGNAVGALAAQRALELAALDPSLVALQERVWALQDEADTNARIKQAADDLAETRRKTAADEFAALQRAVEAEKKIKAEAYKAQAKALQDSIKTVSDTVNTLSRRSAMLRNALGQLAPGGAEGRAAAQSFISTARTLAEAGGTIDDDKLAAALDVVTRPADDLFATFEDYKRDQYKTAIEIADLAELTDSALTVEQRTLAVLEAQKEALDVAYEREIAALDDLVTQAQATLDAINGVRTDVRSVAEALDRFNGAAMNAGGLPIAGSGNNSATAHPSGVNVGGGDSALVRAAKVVYQSMVGGVSSAQYNAAVAAIGGVDKLQGVGDPAAMKRIYGFANGGYHAGGWRMVGEYGRELEYTPPSHITSNRGTEDLLDNSAVVDAIDELKEVVFRTGFKIAANTEKTADNTNAIVRDGVQTTAAT